MKEIGTFQRIKKWGISAVMHGIVLKEIEAGIDMHEPDPAKGIFSYLKYVIAAQPLLFPEIRKVCAVIPGYSCICGKPDEFLAVLKHFVNTIGWKTIRSRDVAYKRILCRKVQDGKKQAGNE